MLNKNPLFSNIPDDLLSSRARNLLGAVQDVHSDEEDDMEPEEVYDMFRTLAMLMAKAIMEPDDEDSEDSDEDSDDQPPSDDRAALCGALTLFDILQVIDADAVHQDADLLSIYISLSLAAENYPQIPEFCHYLEEAEPTEISAVFTDDMEDFLSFIQEKISLPRFLMDYSQRTQKGWAAAAPKLAEAAKQWRKSEKEQSCIGASFQLASYLGLHAMVFPPAKRKGKFAIFLSVLDTETGLYPMLYAKEHIPEELRNKVDVCADTPSASAKEWRDAVKENPEYRDMRLVLKESEDHSGVTVEAYGSELQKLDAKAATEAGITLDMTLSRLLGFYTWHYDVKDVTIPEEGTPPADAISLMQLPQALTNLGYSLNVTLADLERKLHRTYTGIPSESTVLRSDILTGDTHCYKLHEEYLEGCTDAADRLALMGVVPCFLAWPKSIIPDDEKAFCDRLLTYLEAQEASPAYKVIGTASGSRYFYLDLMVWSLNTLIEDVETYFADIPGGDKVLLQCFRAGSKAGPATIERLLAFNDMESEEEKPAKTKKSGPKHPSKKKAKNKKKRRK